MTAPTVPFASLAPHEDAAAVRAAIDRVVARGWYILGPEVDAFEREFAAASGAAHAVAVGNGTDAIALTLRALGIGRGDEPISHRDLTALLIRVAGGGSVRYVEWPPEKKAIDIGSFYADSKKFNRTTGWSATVPVPDGLRRTVAFYRQHFDRYVDVQTRPAEHV